MDRDWTRLSRSIVAAREQCGMTQLELASALGVGRTAVQKLERGHAYESLRPIHRRAAQLFGWTTESPARVLAGGEPTLVDDPTTPASPAASPPTELPYGLSDHVRLTLLGGRAFASDVISMSPSGRSRMVMVLKTDPEVTEEELRQDMKEWEQVQLLLREMRLKRERGES